MGKFNRDSRPSSGGFGKRPFGGGSRSFGDRGQMFKATCGKCGNDCEVPFKPSGDRPVLCNTCFKSQGDTGGRPAGRDFGRPSFGGNRQMHQATCAKCGNKCEVPFAPTAGKPVYCSQCFEKGGNAGAKGGGGGITREQFDQLNSKLDRILKVLSPNAPVASSSAPKADKETKSLAPLAEKGKKKAKAAPVKEKVAVKKTTKKKSK